MHINLIFNNFIKNTFLEKGLIALKEILIHNHEEGDLKKMAKKQKLIFKKIRKPKDKV